MIAYPYSSATEPGEGSACFSLWPGQPIDESQKKWTAGVSHFSLALETSPNSIELQNSRGVEMGLWNCVEGKDVSIEVAMVSADGEPLITIPPPGGIVRIGIACEQYVSNASVEQLFFVLDLNSYLGKVSEKISIVRESKRQNTVSVTGGLLEKVPSDTAVELALKDLRLKCNGSTPRRRVFWIVNGRHDGHSGSIVVTPFLDISIANVIPLSEKDMECHSLSIVACISDVLQVEAVVTKDELQHLTFLCISEVDSMGRIVLQASTNVLSKSEQSRHSQKLSSFAASMRAQSETSTEHINDLKQKLESLLLAELDG
ncbi:hypothetical protein Bca52824_026141 [Brassica carinata]|uniref:Uncharacterized protein n=1 Tax=Brassica carinata TaxID=52824 RepID=A0A8X7SHF3_BRACI|nr:hypothetical protein Bca52824_026141 [Brassica carinata]